MSSSRNTVLVSMNCQYLSLELHWVRESLSSTCYSQRHSSHGHLFLLRQLLKSFGNTLRMFIKYFKMSKNILRVSQAVYKLNPNRYISLVCLSAFLTFTQVDWAYWLLTFFPWDKLVLLPFFLNVSFQELFSSFNLLK